MGQLVLALNFVGQLLTSNQAVPIQYVTAGPGRIVTLSIDGRVEKTFAGKLVFQDGSRSWSSVCADVRSPIVKSQVFSIVLKNSATGSPNLRRAGNIVARFFNAAQSPDQCAGLQLAVWKQIEDGANTPDFNFGHFRAQADMMVMIYAAQYSQSADEDGNALFLQVQSGAGQSGEGSSNSGGGGQSQLSN